MRNIFSYYATIISIALLSVVAPDRVQAQDAKRAITQIKGDLYRFKNNFHYWVFYVTPDGVIVTDPINADAARWLKAEIKQRFNKSIKYLIYSHDHRDHSAGGEVFANDGAIVISHLRTKAVIMGEKRPTAVPNITFKHKLNLELGGAKVELRFLGKNHSDNMIVMRFPKERVLYAVDFIPVKTVAYKALSDAYLPGWIKSLNRVEKMDFDILVPGHGQVGTKADVTLFKDYMRDLYKQVVAAARAGKSLEETKTSVDLSKFKDMAMFAKWGPQNIEGAYRNIQLHRPGN
jgi:glyoxylase-like metal-dependent hydrolase (beta-lactamase superfamily II)